MQSKDRPAKDTPTVIDQHWARVSRDWDVQSSPTLGRLVVPTGNATTAVHRWFHLKEAFSKDLLNTVLGMLPEAIPSDRSISIVDPFSGVGTTVLSAIELRRAHTISALTAVGIEVNPFLHFVSQVKAASAASGRKPDLAKLQSIVARATSLNVSADDFPTLSTFRNSRYFPPQHVTQLIQLRRAIASSNMDVMHTDWANLALAMAVEPSSSLRRDGRTLRYEERTPTPPTEVFLLATSRIAADLTWDTAADVNVTITQGTSIESPWPGIRDGSIDLVIFSPPYPNNIDYTEVYKIELWALAFVNNTDSFREQRQATLRSHPSVKFRRSLSYETDPRKEDVLRLLRPALRSIPITSRYAKPLKRMIEGYADDMLMTFDAAYRSLRTGGYCVYVVGNSVHGTAENPVLIASDVMLARLAELAGFEVVGIHIARELPRRKVSSSFVRESLVILRKK